MAKSKEFFLRFGYTGESLDELKDDVINEIDLPLTDLNDMFFGRSLIYEGPLADRIMATPNFFEEDDMWMCEEHKECNFVMTCVFASGRKDAEKEIKATFLKNALSRIDKMVFIDLESRDPREFDPKEALRSQGVKIGDEAIRS